MNVSLIRIFKMVLAYVKLILNYGRIHVSQNVPLTTRDSLMGSARDFAETRKKIGMEDVLVGLD